MTVKFLPLPPVGAPSAQQPQPFPRPQYDYTREGQWYNPAGTVPSPLAQNMPQAFWTGARQALRFQPGPGGGAVVIRTATIATPVVDLRPDLRHADANNVVSPTTSTGLAPAPVWRPGGGGALYFCIEGCRLQNDNLTDLVVRAREWGHVNDPNLVATMTGLEDITEQVDPDAQTSTLVFTAPGSGYNLRYWRVVVTFDVLSVKPDPNMTVSLGFY